MAVELDEGVLRHVHVGFQAADGARPAVLSWSEDLTGAGALAGSKAKAGNPFARHRCSTLLDAGEYQIFSMDALDMPAAEMKSAMRWKIKDLVEFPVDQATIDVLPIPEAPGQTPQVFVVAARNEVIRERLVRLDKLGVPLQAIDIGETAQRNIASLYEEEGRAVGFLFFEEFRGLFTISQSGELLFSRRLDFNLRQMAAADDAERGALFDRIGLELQRTLDNFERQNRSVSVGRIVIGPAPEDYGLAEFLRNALSLPVLEANLAEVIDFPDAAPPTPRQQWRNLHLIGCALRGQDV